MRHKRVNEAYSLMNDILSSKPVIQPIPSLYSAASPISPRAAAKEKEREKRKKKADRQVSSKPSKHKARMKVPASPNFYYPAPKKTRGLTGRAGLTSEAKVPVVVTITDSDPSKPSKKVQFSNTRGTCMYFRNQSK